MPLILTGADTGRFTVARRALDEPEPVEVTETETETEADADADADDPGWLCRACRSSTETALPLTVTRAEIGALTVG
ncbi:MAG TPA: hypothetical protein VF557_17900 [Jatrophihabitans sp.]|uniref:hypothetical protein n=1 Tax=Jatrophihabitans sp. TaxID=1932789 RepID=UPI002EF02541